MPKIKIGNPIPPFKQLITNDAELSSSTLKGSITVIYFYPRDNTPGCTREGQDFRDSIAKFKGAGTTIYGVSRDNIRSHENFKEKQGLPFELIADVDETMCRIFDVIKEKNMYGKKVLGIERSTFLIDKQGILRQEWRKVKVDGHVLEVLSAAKSLAK